MDSNTPVPNHREVQVETHDRPTAPTTIPPPPLEKARPSRHRRSPRWFVWLIGCLLGGMLLVLLACALVGGLVMGIALKLANEVTASATSTQVFTVSDTPSLDIHDSSGRVQVQPGAPGAVSIQITRSARDSSQSAAQAGLDKIKVNATQTGNQITVTTDFGDMTSFASSSAVDLLITVPQSANIAADITAGSIEINGISGLVELTGGATSVALQDVVLADQSRIHTATGSVMAQGRIDADATVDIVVNTGSVTLQLPADTQTRLDARTNVGAIHVTGWPLQPTRVNRVGAVVNDFLGSPAMGSIHIRVDTGDITVSQL